MSLALSASTTRWKPSVSQCPRPLRRFARRCRNVWSWSRLLVSVAVMCRHHCGPGAPGGVQDRATMQRFTLVIDRWSAGMPQLNSYRLSIVSGISIGRTRRPLGMVRAGAVHIRQSGRSAAMSLTRSPKRMQAELTDESGPTHRRSGRGGGIAQAGGAGACRHRRSHPGQLPRAGPAGRRPGRAAAARPACGRATGVALRSGSNAEFVVGLLAASRADLIAVPLDPALTRRRAACPQRGRGRAGGARRRRAARRRAGTGHCAWWPTRGDRRP